MMLIKIHFLFSAESKSFARVDERSNQKSWRRFLFISKTNWIKKGFLTNESDFFISISWKMISSFSSRFNEKKKKKLKNNNVSYVASHLKIVVPLQHTTPHHITLHYNHLMTKLRFRFKTYSCGIGDNNYKRVDTSIPCRTFNCFYHFSMEWRRNDEQNERKNGNKTKVSLVF